MTLTLNSDDIRRASALLRRLKILKVNLPIIGHVRLSVAPGETEATMEATNLDIGIAMRVPVGFPTTPGSFTMPLADLASIARTADRQTPVRFDREEIPPAPPIDLESGDPEEEESGVLPKPKANPCVRVRKIPRARVTLFTKNMRSHLEIAGLDPDDFPLPPDLTAPPVIMPAAALAAIRRVRPAASKDESRYVLNGVFIGRSDGGFAVATDGRRLAIINTPFATPDVILPNLLVDLLSDPSLQTAALWRNDEEEEKASLQFGKTTIFFTLISGNYPNFRQVIPDPADRNGSCTFPDATLAPLTAWLRNYPGETVTLTLDPPANTITFNVKRPDQGQYSTTALAAFNGTVPPAAAYNATFLADALAINLHTLDLIDEMSPGVLTDGLTRYVLMPMRLTSDPASFPAPAEPDDAPPDDPPEEEEEADADHTEPAADADVIGIQIAV